MKLFGIVNITEDSFSDGGRFLAPENAIAHGRALAANGADVLDLGGAPSNPDAKPIAPEVEIARLEPVVAALQQGGIAISIDSFSPVVQRWAIARDVDYLNDIHGFPDPVLYRALAECRAQLVVMHNVQGSGIATRVAVAPDEIVPRCLTYFGKRIEALTAAGIARNRLILDPGMGFFLGSVPEASFAMLRALPRLKAEFGLPVLVSVSRKSFLRRLTGREVNQVGPASLAAELFAVCRGADYVRTHDPGALRDALTVLGALKSSESAVLAN